MAWQGDDAKIQQLCQMFAAASSPNTQTQQQVMQVLGQFTQLPDFNMYLVAIFVQIPGLPADVRQRSGLLLKSNILAMQKASIQAGMADHINAQALVAMKDSSRAIRHTAGTILTSVVRKIGFAACGQTLERLVETLGEQNNEVVEGGLSAISQICEDGVALCSSVGRRGGVVEPTTTHEAQLFASWANQRALPRMLQCASPDSPAFVRQGALDCLNFFALGGVLVDDAFGLQQHSSRYIQVLGTLAQDTNPDVLQPVCKGFACIIEDGWSCLTAQYTQLILQFMLKASQNQDYNVRLQALAVWIACASQPDTWGDVQKLLPELVPVLITNMVYADADYMILEPSQVENDNANVADPLDSIKPRFHAESNNVDGDEDDCGKVDRSSHGWGAEWTARKAAAASLDELSSVFPEIVTLVLPQIEQKLNHASWEHQEAGVLALGAIGVHCQEKLAQFLPAVLGLLLKLCDSQMPLLRSISCWCVSRFGAWIFHERNPHRQEVIGSVLRVVLPRCLDRNKRVQEASISAILNLAYYGQAQLVPFLNDLVETFTKALQLYQLINQRILFDTIGAVSWAVGPELNKPQYMQSLVAPIFQKFDSVQDNDVLVVPLSECVACLSQTLGASIAPALPRVIARCLRTIAGTEQHCNGHDRAESELMASCCDLLSGILEGLKGQARQLVIEYNVFSAVPLAVKHSSPRAKQSGFWLLAMGAAHCIEQLLPFIPDLMPLCAAGLGPAMSITVSINSSRAIGEVCEKGPPEILTPHLNMIVPALVAILQRNNIQQFQMKGHQELLRNVCTTMNRLRQKTALGQQWPAICAQLSPDVTMKLQQRFGLSA